MVDLRMLSVGERNEELGKKVGVEMEMKMLVGVLGGME